MGHHYSSRRQYQNGYSSDSEYIGLNSRWSRLRSLSWSRSALYTDSNDPDAYPYHTLITRASGTYMVRPQGRLAVEGGCLPRSGRTSAPDLTGIAVLSPLLANLSDLCDAPNRSSDSIVQ